ncbi:MAG TPA: hypothetical protein VN708_27130 [Terriglobales bacterium]|jgi:hypothetical protein|nr:hypothetical protein [Terriglobales bacterium]
MLRIYQSLLHLYPPAHRLEFGDEMAGVFAQANADLDRSLPRRICFYSHEFSGLVYGAAQSHVRHFFGFHDWLPFRRWNMHPGFRFPRSTVVLMCVILAGVVLAIDKAKTVVQMKSGLPHATLAVWDAMFSSILLALLLVLAAVGTVWGILFALHRTGMQRLDNVQTWPEQQ